MSNFFHIFSFAKIKQKMESIDSEMLCLLQVEHSSSSEAAFEKVNSSCDVTAPPFKNIVCVDTPTGEFALMA